MATQEQRADPGAATPELDATIAAEDGAAPRRAAATADAPAKIGRHIVIEELGAGGMGIVYAAYDPELDRRLAIKVIPIRRRRGGDRATARARILREAQAMAKVSHPNVVQIFDVGVVDDRDQVYIAMELIPGETLRAWLDAEARPWRTIVERFIAAGEGLAAAHDAGLIHRDFKPDNVLLDRRGRARVADFGLARASAGRPLDGDGDGDDRALEDAATDPGHDTGGALLRSDLTHAGALLGTPAYMSPEHFAGAELDPRSDLFSFAVSLYEALYAERPFPGESLAKLCHAVTEGMIRPPPPGRRVPPWLRRALLRALSPAPEDRQGSMRELLEQLRRGLGRRRRALQLTGVAALAAAVGVASIALADATRDGCDDVDAALAGVWDDGRRDALRDAYARSDLVYAEAAGARAIAALDAYAEAWSAASRAACEAARDGDPEGLAQLRRRCLREALTIVDARAQLLATADDAVIDATERLVAGLRPLAECDDADLLRSALPLPADPLERGAIDDLRGRLAAIDARLSAGQIELGLEQVAGVLRDAEATGYTPVLAEARFREAALLRQHQRFDDAKAAGLRAYGLAEEAEHRRLRAEIANEMIYVAGRAGQENAATLWATIAAALLRGLPRADALAARYRRNLAAMRFFLGDFEAAAAEAAAAVEAADAAFGADHPEALDVRSNYGAILAVRGDNEGALDVLGRALADAERLHGATHPRIANILQNISVSELSLKRYDDALGHIRRERAIREAVYGRDHANVFPSTCNLATTLISAGRVDEATPEIERCAALAARHFDHESRDAALVAMIQCTASEARGRLDEAAEHCQRGLALRSKLLGADHPETAQSELRLADIFALQGRCDDAHARWQAAEAVLRAKSPDRAPTPAPKCAEAGPRRGR